MRGIARTRHPSRICEGVCGIVPFRSTLGRTPSHWTGHLDQTHAPPSRIRPRGWGLPIGVWLILGFAFIIGAFVTANILAQRSTRLATADVTRVQQEFEPLARHARDLGAAVAAFDRAVLAYLRSSSSGNGTAIVDAGIRLVQRDQSVGRADADRRRGAFQRDRRAHRRAPGGRVPARRDRGTPSVDATGARCGARTSSMRACAAPAPRACRSAIR